MLDKEKSIDAVTVVIPDHMHATVALAAMQRGKHVYVEKPLTRTPWEARLLTDAAARYKVATQMGNQGYSHEATRVAAEIIWSGEIGDVTEVHSFRGRASWPQGMQTLPAPEKVPDTLDWDLWLGGAAFRPYTSGDEAYRKEYNQQQFGFYLPFNWRGFYDFGTSLIGDWGIHQLGPGEPGAAAGQPGQRRVHEAGRRPQPVHVPARRRRHQVGVRGAREHAAGDGLLVRHRGHVHSAGHDRRADARRFPAPARRSRAAAAVARARRRRRCPAARRRRGERRRRSRARPAAAVAAAGRPAGRAAATTPSSSARRAISAPAAAAKASA